MRWGWTKNESVPTPVKICKSHANVGKPSVQRVRSKKPLNYYSKGFIHVGAGQEKLTSVLTPKSLTVRIQSML